MTDDFDRVSLVKSFYSDFPERLGKKQKQEEE